MGYIFAIIVSLLIYENYSINKEDIRRFLKEVINDIKADMTVQKNNWVKPVIGAIVSGCVLYGISEFGAMLKAQNIRIDSKVSKEEHNADMRKLREDQDVNTQWIMRTLDKIDKKLDRLEDKQNR